MLVKFVERLRPDIPDNMRIALVVLRDDGEYAMSGTIPIDMLIELVNKHKPTVN